MINAKSPVNLFLLFVLITTGCKSVAQDKYIISVNIDSSELKYEKLFPPEMQAKLDSMTKTLNLKPETKIEKEYKESRKNNVAVIYCYDSDTLVKFKNEGAGSENFIRAISQAIYYNDTLQIVTGVGFFASNSIMIKIAGDGFTGAYNEDADHTPVFKYTKNDSNYIDDITVNALSEKLILNKRPTFNNGEVLMGEYEGVFKPFYEKEVGEEHIRKVKWRVIFKCVISNYNELMIKKLIGK